jgi:hypothetical protein
MCFSFTDSGGKELRDKKKKRKERKKERKGRKEGKKEREKKEEKKFLSQQSCLTMPGCYALQKASLRVSQWKSCAPYVLVVSWLAEKAGLPDSCCHGSLKYLFETMQVKVPGSISYPPSWFSPTLQLLKSNYMWLIIAFN